MAWDPLGDDRRTGPRHHVSLPAVLRGYRRPPVTATVEDVSNAGALVAGTVDGIMRGDELLLDLDWSEFVVTVAWVTEGHLGVAFHRPLDGVELDGLRRRGRARA